MQLLMIAMYNCCDYGLHSGKGTCNSDNWHVRDNSICHHLPP